MVTDYNTEDRIKHPTIKALEDAGIDIIECGFLKLNSPKNDSSRYSSAEELTPYITPKKPGVMYVAMFGSYEEYSIDTLPERTGEMIDGIRLCTDKQNLEKAFKACKQIENRGYKVILQPINTVDYSEDDILRLIEGINKVEPNGAGIVDTKGNMMPQKASSLCEIYDKNLDKNIALGFHFHNNMQLAFGNAIAILNKIGTEREYRLDSSIFGMGRAAGNLSTELIINYLNSNFGCRYDENPVIAVYEKYYADIFNHTPWGYNIKHYFTAKYSVNPYYATLLSKKLPVSLNELSYLISLIPDEFKNRPNFTLVEKIIADYQKQTITFRRAEK
jgi:4-hydroxy 2-oxovalerate aldolase